MPKCVTYVPGIKRYLCVRKLNPSYSNAFVKLVPAATASDTLPLQHSYNTLC